MKKVLIISYSYPPSNVPSAQRPYALAKYLNKDKYQVYVATCSNPESALGFNDKFNPELNGVKLIKIKSWIGSSMGLIRPQVSVTGNKNAIFQFKRILLKGASKLLFPDKAIFWFYNAHKEVKRICAEKNIDVVFTTSPMITNHLLGLYIKKVFRKIHWVADFRDFYFVANNKAQSGFKLRLKRSLENRIISNCDKASFISSEMCELYKAHYTSQAPKMETIYNGIDKEDFEHLPIKRLKEKKLIIFYAGSFYNGIRSPFPLLSMLDNLSDQGIIDLNNISIRIAGNMDQDTIDHTQQFKSSFCITYLGKIPRAKVLEEMVRSSILWLIVGNDITHYTGVPIKFYEYLAARRPILNFAPSISEPSKIILQYKLGWSINTLPFNQEKGMEVMKNIINSWFSTSFADPLPYSELQIFDREHQATIFEELFE